MSLVTSQYNKAPEDDFVMVPLKMSAAIKPSTEDHILSTKNTLETTSIDIDSSLKKVYTLAAILRKSANLISQYINELKMRNGIKLPPISNTKKRQVHEEEGKYRYNEILTTLRVFNEVPRGYNKQCTQISEAINILNIYLEKSSLLKQLLGSSLRSSDRKQKVELCRKIRCLDHNAKTHIYHKGQLTELERTTKSMQKNFHKQLLTMKNGLNTLFKELSPSSYLVARLSDLTSLLFWGTPELSPIPLQKKNLSNQAIALRKTRCLAPTRTSLSTRRQISKKRR